MYTAICYNNDKGDMMSTTFILVRHGEPRYDEIKKDDKYGIAWDFGRLTDDGVEQAKHRAEDNRFSDADLIISSPYTRALETAAIIASKTGLDIRVETNLHEWTPDITYHYSFSPEKQEEIKESVREFFSCEGIKPLHSKLKWEELSHVKDRVMKVLNTYLSCKKVIVVCHGIVINSLTSFGEQIPFCGVREIIVS